MKIKIVIDCNDLGRQAEFWCAAADYDRLDEWDTGYASLRAPDPSVAPDLLLQRVAETKDVKNRLHLDLHPEDGPTTVTRLQSLGAGLVGPVNREFESSTGTLFQVMVDPEGNEFCVAWRTQPTEWD